mgnify:FL=1
MNWIVPLIIALGIVVYNMEAKVLSGGEALVMIGVAIVWAYYLLLTRDD